MKLSQKSSIQVDTDLNALPRVLSWFDQFQDPVLPHAVWLPSQLALAEGFTNAVRHAHKDKPKDTPIEIEIRIYDAAFEIRIWDYGSGFDFDRQIAQAAQKLNQEAAGGRGLGLMKRIADTLGYYQTSDDRNCLLIVKHYGDSG
ncbi:MAG: anti-sigma regulatory factor [Cyanobacteria bacterium P01_A01_bin.135]